MIKKKIDSSPLLTGTTNISYTPVIIPTQIPPNITYAGGKPIYATLNEIESVSTITATVGNIATLNTALINLDGNALTTTTNELLFNGQPLATVSSIKAIEDWSYYSAVSTLQMNNQNLVGGGDFQISSINGASASVAAWSLYKASSDVNMNFDSLTDVGSVNLVSGANAVNLTAGAGNVLNVNGSPITGTATSVLVDGGVNVANPAVATITAQNGAYGVVQITAQPGYGSINGGNIGITAAGGGSGGLNGRIDIISQYGSSGGGFTTGGLINIIAQTGVGLSNLTSAVKIEAGGINSYAGVVPTFGSVFGYNFIYGSAGVNICATAPSIIPNVPGTVYLYAPAGIELNSDVYATNFYPYWDAIHKPADLTINGRTTSFGATFVNVNNVNQISFDILGAGSITGLQSINGVPYNTLTINALIIPVSANPLPPLPPNPDTLSYTLNLADVGSYITVATSSDGKPKYSLDFEIGTFPIGGTFYLKNVDFTNQNDIFITISMVDAIGNTPLFPTSSTANSALCVVQWDGTNLNIL
jgi:hypothetical protein